MVLTSQFGLLHSHFSSAIAVMLEKHGIACDMMHGFNWDKWTGQMTNDEVGMAN